MLRVVLALCVLSGSTQALAASKPWQWTTAQAAAAISAKGDELRNPSDFVSARCRGVTKASPGRFTSFRCTAVLEDGSVVLNAKTRRAGGLCWAEGKVPSGCLAPGARGSGSLSAVARAVYAKLGAPAQTFSATAHGSGFYSWAWVSGDSQRQGTVTFSPAPVLRELP